MIDQDQEGLDLQLSLREGLRRANDSEETISEIQNILTELDETVRRVTDSVVSVSLENPRPTKFNEWLGVLEFFRKEAAYANPEDRELEELEVFAKITPTQGHADARRICRMTMSEDGYPVTVDSGTHVDGCHDATALRRSFAQILGRATTGRKLRALIQRHQERQASLKAEGDEGSPPQGELGAGSSSDRTEDSQE